MAAKRPPKLLRVNQPMGQDWTPVPWISVRAAPDGTRVPLKGDAMKVSRLCG